MIQTLGVAERGLRLLRVLGLCGVVAAGLASIVASGGGVSGSGDDGLGPLGRTYLGALRVTPDIVHVGIGATATVRVDTTLLPPGDGVTGYSIGLPEAQAHIDISTAPCPPGIGSASCQDWTITPKPGAAPGEHLVDIASVGARSGDLSGTLRIRVVGTPLDTQAAAVDHGSAEREPFGMFDGPTLVLQTDGRIATAGANMSGQAGVGYQPFDADGVTRFTPRPWFLDEFVVVANGAAFEKTVGGRTVGRWIGIGASANRSFALRDDRTVWTWGNPPGEPALGEPFEPRQVTLLPPIRAISAGRTSGALALADDGTVWSIPDLGYQSHPSQLPPRQISVGETAGVASPLTSVVAIAGSVNSTALFIQAGGRVWLQHAEQEHASALPGVPGNATRIATTRESRLRGTASYYLILLDNGVLLEGRNDAGGETFRTVALPGNDFTEIAAGAEFASALRRDGTVWTWRPFATSPSPVAGLVDIEAIGPDHAIGRFCGDGASQMWRILKGSEAARLRSFRSIGGCRPAPRSFTLTVETSGPDPVEILPHGTVCRGRCETTVTAGSIVRLAVPLHNRDIGTGDPRCVIGGLVTQTSFAMNSDVTCRYDSVADGPPESLPFTLAVEGPGSVTITPPGTVCTASCNQAVTARHTFLTPHPAAGHRFDGFVGAWDCERGVVNLDARASAASEARRLALPTTMSEVCTARFVALAAPPSARLDIGVSGSGKVVSTPAGIDCGSACSAVFALDRSVALDARPAPGFRFAGWSGVSGCGAVVTMSASRTCVATFVAIGAPPTATLTVIVTGSGSVTVDAAAPCRTRCESIHQTVPPAMPTLVALADPGHAFAGWSGDCVGAATTTVAMSAAKSCSALFVAVLPTGWQQLGADVVRSSLPRMSIAVDRRVAAAPVVYAATAQLNAGYFDLVVYRFDGTLWAVVGGGRINETEPPLSAVDFTPAIAIDGGGNVYVAWAENGARIRVKRWNSVACEATPSGCAWDALAENLQVDPGTSVFGTRIAVSGSGQVVVAWLESPAGQPGLGRMAVKRWIPATGAWSGGPVVLAQETDVYSLRLATDSLGRAIVMFAQVVSTVSGLEGPPRVVREDGSGAWREDCPGSLARPNSTHSSLPSNTTQGFGVAASPADGIVAVFNNGEAVFAVACSGGAWIGLDGSAQGLVPGIAAGETFLALAVNGLGLAFTKAEHLASGDRQIWTQVLVHNGTIGTPLTSLAVPFMRRNTGLANDLVLDYLDATSPLIGGRVLDGNYVTQVHRYVP